MGETRRRGKNRELGVEWAHAYEYKAREAHDDLIGHHLAHEGLDERVGAGEVVAHLKEAGGGWRGVDRG